jgi:hypothetical protein
MTAAALATLVVQDGMSTEMLEIRTCVRDGGQVRNLTEAEQLAVRTGAEQMSRPGLRVTEDAPGL